MRRDEAILMITSGLFRLSGEHLEEAMTYFGQFYELHEPQRPGHVSIGTFDANGNIISFATWLRNQKQDSISGVRCVWTSPSPRSNMAPHIEAAFSGSQLLTLQIISSISTKTFILRTMMSPQHEMSPEQFVELVNQQELNASLWERADALVKEHCELNSKSYDSKNVKEFLLKEGRSEFDFLSSKLVTELQLESIVNGAVFTIPASFDHLFFKSDFLMDEPDVDHVYLYPLKSVSTEEISSLIKSQQFKDNVWQAVASQISEYPGGLPEISAEEWPERLHNLDADELSNISYQVCRAICALCEKHHLDRVIPEQLSESFGPDELEHKRAQARGRSSRVQKYLSSTKDPWECYVFEALNNVNVKSPEPIAQTRKHFETALTEIIKFAEEIKSPFAEAFRLSLFLVNSTREGSLDESHVSSLRKQLKDQQFSEYAIERFDGQTSYIKDMHMLKFSPSRMSDLMAISVADVFGGMGSWNDQYVDSDQHRYEQVSADLFNALKSLFSSTLSK